VSSNQPDESPGEVYGREEVSRGFVVACSDGAKEFKLGKEVFDQVTSFVKVFVVFALDLAVALGWNDRDLARLLQGNQHSLVGIEAFVAEQDAGFQLRQQLVGPVQIAGLPAGEMKSYRVAEGVYGCVNLGAQPAFAASDGLVRAPFLRAPALC
jgi:hypothetical protein